MRVIEQTPQLLKLREVRPRINLVGLLLGVPFMAAGLLVIVRGEWVTLRCDHTLLKQQARTLPIVRVAEVESVEDSDGGDTYRVRLRTRNGYEPLTESFTLGRGGKERIAHQINTFITTPEQVTLEIHQDLRWAAYSLGGLCSLVGAIALLLSMMPFKRAFCDLDKVAGRGHWQGRQGFMLLPSQEFHLKNVKKAEVVSVRGSDDAELYTAQLVLQKGNGLPLWTGYNSQKAKALTEAVNQFLAS